MLLPISGIVKHPSPLRGEGEGEGDINILSTLP